MIIKLADATSGTVTQKGIDKLLKIQDREKLQEGVDLCCEIFHRLGFRNEETILGTINAGHPGGMLPRARDDAATLHSKRLPENLYVADATLFRQSPGNPPTLTIMALAKKIEKIFRQNQL